jgi:hypothetical protein
MSLINSFNGMICVVPTLLTNRYYKFALGIAADTGLVAKAGAV